MSSVRPLRVGAVSYLNTKPLVYRLDEFAPSIELTYDLPSRLATGLADGRFDVALIPSIEFFQKPEYRIVSNACIACRGPVWSVKLFSRVPLTRIESLALDEGSRTSVALVQILLRERFGIAPTTQPLPIGANVASTSADAVLLIGDRAIHRPLEEFVEEWDLGEEWCQWAGLPFVFAMWVAREDCQTGDFSQSLERARDAGVQHLAEIAIREAPAMRLSAEACLSYLRDNLYFYLGAREREGLEMFRRQATAVARRTQPQPVD